MGSGFLLYGSESVAYAGFINSKGNRSLAVSAVFG